MPDPAHAPPVDMEELLARLRQISAENTNFEGAVTVPTRVWTESNETEDVNVFQLQWLARALHTEAWQPLLLLDVRQFVTLAYRRFLGRKPDVSGMEYLTAQLTARHIPRAEIIAELVLSEEALRLQPYCWRRWRWFGRLLRLVLRMPLVGAWGRARLQWLARGVLRRSERWLTRYAQTSDWAASWAQARIADTEWRRLHDQVMQQRAMLEDMWLYLQYLEEKDKLHNSDMEHYMTAFEEHFRGPEANLRAQWQHDYIPFLHAARERSGGEGPCLDLGCGRGTWLALLQDEGFIGCGIDSNAIPVSHARAQGLDATVGDAFGWLQTQPANSALAVTAFHLVEHLPFALRLALTKEIARVLRPGGVLIYETPNPENIWVGAHTFYHDPTHSTPVTPASLSFLTNYCGLKPDLYRLHPGPQEDLLPGEDAVAARINRLMCGAQDYAIVAWKPVDKATT